MTTSLGLVEFWCQAIAQIEISTVSIYRYLPYLQKLIIIIFLEKSDGSDDSSDSDSESEDEQPMKKPKVEFSKNCFKCGKQGHKSRDCTATESEITEKNAENKWEPSLGMISFKKSSEITIFGHKHKILNFIKKFEDIRKNSEFFIKNCNNLHFLFIF